MTYTFDTALARAERLYYAAPDEADPCDECDGMGIVVDRETYDADRASYWTEPDLWDFHPAESRDEGDYDIPCDRC